MFEPKPASVREYVLARARPSLWYYASFFVVSGVLIAAGARMLYVNHELWKVGFGLMAAGAVLVGFPQLLIRGVSWSVTSDRLIEQRGLLGSRRREMELSDIRSIEVDKRAMQRLFGLGNVTIASAASADFSIRLNDIAEPDAFAETVRKARLRRLA